jgi:hypothetical protein
MWFNMAIEIDPYFSEPWYRIGEAHNIMGQHESAQRYFDRAKQLGFNMPKHQRYCIYHHHHFIY